MHIDVKSIVSSNYPGQLLTQILGQFSAQFNTSVYRGEIQQPARVSMGAGATLVHHLQLIQNQHYFFLHA